jgi:hypothetical protein
VVKPEIRVVAASCAREVHRRNQRFEQLEHRDLESEPASLRAKQLIYRARLPEIHTLPTAHDSSSIDATSTPRDCSPLDQETENEWRTRSMESFRV